MTGAESCRLAIIIINYRTPELVENCLRSLRDDLEAPDTRAVVVDNFSNDGSADRLEAWLVNFPARESVSLIRSSENTGFSGGNNIGIKSQAADYYLLLNSDAYVRPGAIRTLIDAAEANPEAGIIGPRLEWPDAKPQTSCFRYHSPASELISAAATGPITKILKAYDVPTPASEELIHPQWVSFACVLVRHAVIRQVGYMDESYFMYYDDVDYCRSARDVGWDVIYQPQAHVVHLRGGSSPVKKLARARKRLPKYYYASRTYYFYKFYGRFGLLAANLLWTLGWLIAMLRSLFGRPAWHINERQIRDIWLNWWRPMGDCHAPEG